MIILFTQNWKINYSLKKNMIGQELLEIEVKREKKRKHHNMNIDFGGIYSKVSETIYISKSNRIPNVTFDWSLSPFVDSDGLITCADGTNQYRREVIKWMWLRVCGCVCRCVSVCAFNDCLLLRRFAL